MKKESNSVPEKVAWAKLSIVSNTSLTILKICVGLFIFSVSVISEALHSGIDIIAAIMAAYSIHKATMPPDKEHRFGHGKFENLSGLFEAVLIFVIAGVIIYESVDKIINGAKIHTVELGIAVMIVSVIINIIVSRKLLSVARKEDSIALEVDAYHLSADVWTSGGVLFGLVIIKIGQWYNIAKIDYIDPIVAILVAVFIMKTAYSLTKKSCKDLIDTNLPRKEERIIKATIEKHYPRYIGYHGLRTRKSGAERHIDLHLVVSKNTSVEDAHDLCDHLEKEIKNQLQNSNVLIHIEPCDGECKECKHLNKCSIVKYK